MQKTLSTLNYKKKIRLYFSFSAVICFMALISLPTKIYSTNNIVVPQEITRFIFKYYNVLSEKELITETSEQLKRYFPLFNQDVLSDYILHNSKVDPIDFNKFLESEILEMYPNEDEFKFRKLNIRELSKDEWIKFSDNVELYLLFISENSSKTESSFGHISLLYQTNNFNYFDIVISFAADNFVNEETGKPTFTSYLKGAFSKLNGTIDNYYFFDSIYQYLIKEERMIVKYKIHLFDNNKRNFNEEIWELAHQENPYNFFTKNCSYQILNTLKNNCNTIFNIYPFQTPAKSIRILEKRNIISYDSTFLVSKKNNKIEHTNCTNYNLSQYSYNTNVSLYSYDSKFFTEVTLFHNSRNFKGLVDKTAGMKLMEFIIPFQNNFKSDLVVKLFELNLNSRVYNNWGLKNNFIYRKSINWNFISENGLYFKLNNMKLEVYYSNDVLLSDYWNFDIIFSNRLVDLIFANKINFKSQKVNPELYVELYSLRNLSLFIKKNNKIFMIGSKYFF